MTIQLNRIHVEIRENLNSEVKDDFVSRKIELNVDNKMKKPFLKGEEEEKEKKKKKKLFTIDGMKNNDNNIQVEAEFKQEKFKETSTGIFIDKMK